jgi:hypothetical protein
MRKAVDSMGTVTKYKLATQWATNETTRPFRQRKVLAALHRLEVE